MVAMSSPVRMPGAETPMKTSAPSSTSWSEPVTCRGLVCSASQTRMGSGSSAPRCTGPVRPTPTMSVTPARSSSRMMALPAAPTPETTTRRSAISLSTMRSALMRAA